MVLWAVIIGIGIIAIGWSIYETIQANRVCAEAKRLCEETRRRVLD